MTATSWLGGATSHATEWPGYEVDERSFLVTPTVASAYSATAGEWQRGPGRIYDRLADVVVAGSPVPLTESRVLDVGAGTGAVSRAALAGGAARVVAVDIAPGMLAHDASRRPPAAVGDTLALPFAACTFDVAVAAFSLNHLIDPAVGLREMARVTRPGGAVVAAAYSYDDTHPVKAAVDASLADRGWVPEKWYADLRTHAVPKLATIDACVAAAAKGGLQADVEHVVVSFPELDARALVAWRLGMAQNASFIAGNSAEEREAIAAEAVARLGNDASPLERSILVMRVIIPRGSH